MRAVVGSQNQVTLCVAYIRILLSCNALYCKQLVGLPILYLGSKIQAHKTCRGQGAHVNLPQLRPIKQEKDC